MLDSLWLPSSSLLRLQAAGVAQLSQRLLALSEKSEEKSKPSCRIARCLWRTRIHVINLRYSFAIYL